MLNARLDMQQDDEVRMTLRLPAEAARFLAEEARQNFTSRNAQVVRAVRDAMKAKGPAATAIAPSQEHDQPR